MKKILNTIFAVALAVAASTGLAACGDDDDNSSETSKEIRALPSHSGFA